MPDPQPRSRLLMALRSRPFTAMSITSRHGRVFVDQIHRKIGRSYLTITEDETDMSYPHRSQKEKDRASIGSKPRRNGKLPVQSAQSLRSSPTPQSGKYNSALWQRRARLTVAMRSGQLPYEAAFLNRVHD